MQGGGALILGGGHDYEEVMRCREFCSHHRCARCLSTALCGGAHAAIFSFPCVCSDPGRGSSLGFARCVRRFSSGQYIADYVGGPSDNTLATMQVW